MRNILTGALCLSTGFFGYCSFRLADLGLGSFAFIAVVIAACSFGAAFVRITGDVVSRSDA